MSAKVITRKYQKGGAYRRNDPSRRQPSHQQIEWNLADHIANREDGGASDQLIPKHLQIPFHATEIGISNIIEIEVLEEISDLCELSELMHE